MSGERPINALALTDEEQRVLQRVLRCDLRPQRWVTTGVVVFGSFLGVALLVGAGAVGDPLLLAGGVQVLMLTPVLGVVRSRVLVLYSIIQKLWFQSAGVAAPGAKPSGSSSRCNSR